MNIDSRVWWRREGSRVAAGGSNSDDAARSITDIAEIGRDPTAAELHVLRRGVVERGFDPNALERGGGRVSGIQWKGQTLRSSDRLPPAEVHYIRHVLRQREWPERTTFEQYLQSIRGVVQDETSGIFLSVYREQQQLGFIGRSGEWRGPHGKDWILVDFRQETAHIQTAYQMMLDDLSDQPGRSGIRWLKEPS